MDKRFLLAILLTAIVVMTVPRLFPTPPPRRPTVAAGDTLPVAAPPVGVADTFTPPVAAPAVGGALGDTTQAAAPGTESLVAVAESVTVTTPRLVYRFSTVGAIPVQITVPGYASLQHEGERVQLARDGYPIIRFGLATNGDTLALDRMPFAVDSAPGTATGVAPLTFRAPIGPAAEAVIRYTFAPDSYVVRVTGQVTGMPGSQILVTLANGLRSEEADSLDDARNLAYVVKPVLDEPRSIAFAKTDTARGQTEQDGPYIWIASKNKYFLVALLAPDSAQMFGTVRITPEARAKRDVAKDVAATVSRPLGTDGAFAFELYTGPQEWRRLVALGRDMGNVNPYGGWFKGVIQPFATAVMRLLLWMHDQLRLSYGWVLVIFGILVRIVLWPLNQGAMRSQLKLQALQPEMQAIQKKFGKDPQKQQEEIMSLYKRHGMSPMSPILGCLPMLIPMPFLFALFFVFQNTIEFRGVPFLWLTDISQKDPYYILPILMGVSMFILSWIGLRNSPPNPQAKMLAYLMPAMMTFFLLNLASGLNLYYAVQNIAAMPQQWLIARERAKSPMPTAAPAAVAKT
ncbi:MAG: membrane protein insertase YidC [Gemmatimonadota bacterium]|nr:membrane protein insertase YidC [Gemmatimonadota bacterium]